MKNKVSRRRILHALNIIANYSPTYKKDGHLWVRIDSSFYGKFRWTEGEVNQVMSAMSDFELITIRKSNEILYLHLTPTAFSYPMLMRETNRRVFVSMAISVASLVCSFIAILMRG